MNKLPKSKLPQMENYRSEIFSSSLCSKKSLKRKKTKEQRDPKTESIEIQSKRVFRMVYLLTRNPIITIALLRIIWNIYYIWHNILYMKFSLYYLYIIYLKVVIIELCSMFRYKYTTHTHIVTHTHTL